MKKLWFSLALVAMVAAVACTPTSSDDPLGNGNNNNNSNNSGSNQPTATPTPLPTINFFSPGSLGTWFGRTLMVETGAFNTFDPATGQLSQSCSDPAPGACASYPHIGWVKFTTVASGTYCVSPGPTIPSGYILVGKIDFDLHIDTTQSLVAGVYLYWGDPGCYYQATFIPVANLANCFGAGNFGHVSVFLHDMPISFACQSSCGKTVPLQISVAHQGSDTQPLVYVLNNVKWTQ